MMLQLNPRALETSLPMPAKPVTAMVLAAGLGLRMRPITEKIPKPLVRVAGKTLLDHVLDKLAEIGVEKAVVNVHYLPDQIIHHVAERAQPRIVISDERNEILGTGGGVVKALPQLGTTPFFHMNADTMWIDGVRSNLARLADAFDPARMDMLMLMAPTASSIGYDGRGDYTMSADGTLHKRKEKQIAPFVYAGAAIMSPQLFAAAPHGEFGLPTLFDAAEEAGRLYGLRLEGTWMHVGTPEAIAEAERAVLESAA
jgi:N-acetyl-alpha-D-muramate 1-phosphate uridylyltransferase